MSLNDDLLMELLDGEIPDTYRQRVEDKLLADKESAAKLRKFRSMQRAMKTADEPDFSGAKDRVRLRLERGISGSSQREYQGKRSFLSVSTHGGVYLSFPAAAAVAAVLVAAVVFNFIPGVDPLSGAASPVSMDVDNYSEFSEVDPEFVSLLSRPSAPPQLRLQGGSPEALAAGSSGQNVGEGINLQINVRDVEQLLRLLEGAPSLGSNLNGITIQLPSENKFEILGDSQLRRTPVQEDE